MKRILSFLALALFAGTLTISCSTQKKSCAAYSNIEYQNPADNS